MAAEKKRRGLGNRAAAAVKPEDDAADVARRERDARVFELRTVQCLTYPQISRELGIPETTAREGFQRVYASLLPSNVEEVRSEEEAHLQRLKQENLLARQSIMGRMNERDREGKLVAGHAERAELAVALAKVVTNAIRISDSRRRLHGADKPVRHEHSGPDGGPVPVAAAKTSFAELLELAERNSSSESDKDEDL